MNKKLPEGLGGGSMEPDNVSMAETLRDKADLIERGDLSQAIFISLGEPDEGGISKIESVTIGNRLVNIGLLQTVNNALNE